MKSIGSTGTAGRHLTLMQVVVLILILLAGGAYIRLRIATVDRNMRDQLLMRTRLMAEAINIEQLKMLSGTPRDLDHPAYLRLKRQLMLLKAANPDLASIFLLGRKPGGKLFFLIDGKSADAPDCAVPGSAFEDSSEEFNGALAKWSEIVEGPDHDRGGTWISTMVPILDSLAGKSVAGLGVDIGVTNWKRALVGASLPGMALTLVLASLVLGWMLLYNRKKQRGDTAPCRAVCLNTIGVAVVGAVLTGFISWRVMVQEEQTRTRIFEQFATGETELIARIVRVMRSAEFEGLQSFLAHSKTIEKNEFREYCDHLVTNPLVWAWVWVPMVPGGEKTAFETAARQTLGNGFRLWQFGPDGKREPVTERNAYFPVFFAVPEAKNSGVVGFDLGSDPTRWAAIKESLRSGLPVATDPVHLINDPPKESGMLIFNPVFTIGEKAGKLRGFAMIVIRLSALLNRNFLHSDTIRISLSLLRTDAPPQQLASRGRAVPDSGIRLSRPVLALGKVFILTARPGPAFIQAYPRWKYLLSMLIGLGFTAASALIVMLVGRRRAELERLVEERTFRLKEREERFLLLAEHSRTLTWDYDLEGRFTYVNKVFEPVLGYRPEELVGRLHFYDIYPESRREAVRKWRFELMAKQQSFHNVEAQMQAKDGRLVWVSSSGMPHFDRDGKLIGYCCECTDISVRKTAEEAAARQHEFRKMLTEVATTYINLPLDRIDQAINRTLGELGRFFEVDRFYIFEYDFENQCGSNTYEWCAPGIPSQIDHFQNTPFGEFRWWLDTTCRGETINLPEVEALASSDPVKKILQEQNIKSLLCVPMMSDGQCIGFTGFDAVRDHHRATEAEAGLLRVFADMLVNIQSRRRTEEELRRRGKAAEAANRAKSEFLTNMSHEIRTPMNGILGVSEMLSETALDTEQQNYVGMIQSSGKLMLALINEILDYTKLETGGRQTKATDFKINELLDCLCGDLIPAAHAKNLNLIISVAPEVPKVLCGDMPHLLQVLMNLTDNAIKFTQRGEITITVSTEGESPDSLLLRFAVRDTGIGIAKEQYGPLFDAFYQGDASLSRRYGGAGLGLPIAKQLVRLMGGELNFQSDLGAGSEFYFTIPLRKVAGAPSSRGWPRHWRKVRVLAIDGNRAVRQFLNDELTLRRFNPELAADPKAALALLDEAVEHRDPFHAVLVDFGLFDGPADAELTAILSSGGFAPGGAVAVPQPGCRFSEEELRKIGFAAILPKPIRSAELDRVLGQVVPDGAATPHKPALLPPPPRLEEDSTPTGNPGVLLAEDNSTNRKVMLLMLRKLNLQTDVAVNGLEVLERLAVKSYGVVLMDVQMPEMDGFEATRKIRDPASGVLDHRVPIIAVTAHAVAGYEERCREAGMDDYLAKPVTPKSLREVLSRWLKLDDNAAKPS